MPNAHAIRGNADRLRDPDFATDEGLGWLLEQLDEEHVEWLVSLPFSVVLENTLYVHATPLDDTTVVTELTTDEKLAALLRDVEQSRVVALVVRGRGRERAVEDPAVAVAFEQLRGHRRPRHDALRVEQPADSPVLLQTLARL